MIFEILVMGNANTDFILKVLTALPTRKARDQFVASTAPGLNPAVLAAVEMSNQ
jgi:hypothetical protein